MKDAADKIIDDVILREGSKYTNDPQDSGGPTKFGITQSALAAFRGHPVSPEDVDALTEADARLIYRLRYIIKPGYEPILALSARIGTELVDTGVNAGPAVATGFLQRLLNAFNNGGTLYPDLRVDGECGPGTVSALAAYLRRRGAEGEAVMLAGLNHLQGAFYIDLAERRPKDETYAYGWVRSRTLA